MAAPKKTKKKTAAKKAAPKKAAPRALRDSNDYRGFCLTENKPINRRWKTQAEADAEKNKHQAETGHNVDIEERQ